MKETDKSIHENGGTHYVFTDSVSNINDICLSVFIDYAVCRVIKVMLLYNPGWLHIHNALYVSVEFPARLWLKSLCKSIPALHSTATKYFIVEFLSDLIIHAMELLESNGGILSPLWSSAPVWSKKTDAALKMQFIFLTNVLNFSLSWPGLWFRWKKALLLILLSFYPNNLHSSPPFPQYLSFSLLVFSQSLSVSLLIFHSCPHRLRFPRSISKNKLCSSLLASIHPYLIMPLAASLINLYTVRTLTACETHCLFLSCSFLSLIHLSFVLSLC